MWPPPAFLYASPTHSALLSLSLCPAPCCIAPFRCLCAPSQPHFLRFPLPPTPHCRCHLPLQFRLVLFYASPQSAVCLCVCVCVSFTVSFVLFCNYGHVCAAKFYVHARCKPQFKARQMVRERQREREYERERGGTDALIATCTTFAQWHPSVLYGATIYG